MGGYTTVRQGNDKHWLPSELSRPVSVRMCEARLQDVKVISHTADVDGREGPGSRIAHMNY